IILDNGSEDNTLQIAEEFSNVKIFKDKFIGFGPLKNKAASYAQNDWIFNVDSDEIVEKILIEKIQDLNNVEKDTVFYMNRANYLLGEKVKFSGWNKDKIYRMYNKKHTSFKNVMVHESIILENSKIKKIDGNIKHYAVYEITQFLDKIKRYSALERENLKKRTLLGIFLRSIFAFIKTYIFQFGFLDGWRGLLIAVSNFNGVFYKYIIKTYSLSKKGYYILI
ncbi:MAG: glycosyltransferase family 2 protein, partial [Candidatus Absconditabacterales bacterium]|nr:glycosyltransferase family 2 protein [Candidatus Absconditabacterales bacterium]